MDLTKREDQEGWSALERLLQIARRDTGQSQVETEYRRMRRVAVCAGCGNEVSLTFGNRLRTRREESRGYDKTKRLWMTLHKVLYATSIICLNVAGVKSSFPQRFATHTGAAC
jgi:hypothetical protein